MNQQERVKLTDLLTDLITAQNDITFANTKGGKYRDNIRNLIATRNSIKDEIFSFVESLTEVKGER